jgi:acyl carrier protein
VIAREDTPGSKYLAAYLIMNGPTMPPASDLRDFLARTLPDYMLPSAFVRIESLPLTPNGKVNRKGLPAPDHVAAPEAVRIAPRDMVERALAEMWQTLLTVPEVGIRDNFFEMGGHSLLAVQLLAEVEKTFGKRLPLITLFEGPTIEKVAAALRSRGLTKSMSPMVALQAGGVALHYSAWRPWMPLSMFTSPNSLARNKPSMRFSQLTRSASPIRCWN